MKKKKKPKLPRVTWEIRPAIKVVENKKKNLNSRKEKHKKTGDNSLFPVFHFN
jgi:hypothetical protein